MFAGESTEPSSHPTYSRDSRPVFSWAERGAEECHLPYQAPRMSLRVTPLPDQHSQALGSEWFHLLP